MKTKTTRLFFRESVSQPVDGGGAVHYHAGHFYNVDDPAVVDTLVAAGTAETEAQHELRLAAEQAALATPAQDMPAAEGEDAAVDAPVPVIDDQAQN